LAAHCTPKISEQGEYTAYLQCELIRAGFRESVDIIAAFDLARAN